MDSIRRKAQQRAQLSSAKLSEAKGQSCLIKLSAKTRLVPCTIKPGHAPFARTPRSKGEDVRRTVPEEIAIEKPLCELPRWGAFQRETNKK